MIYSVVPSEARIHSPAILYLNRLGKGHFVILKGIDDAWVLIAAPARGNLDYTREQFKRHWLQPDGMGRALVLIQRIGPPTDEKMVVAILSPVRSIIKVTHRN